MVQVVVDGRDLESERQTEDVFDVVETVVVFDDEPVLGGFRQALEIRCETFQCGCFISVDAADMQNDFVFIVYSQAFQHFGVVREIEDGARHDVFVRRIQTVYCPGWNDTRMPLFWIFAPMRLKASSWISGQGSVLTGLEPNGIRSELMRNSWMLFLRL